jgi:hypothetical protein
MSPHIIIIYHAQNLAARGIINEKLVISDKFKITFKIDPINENLIEVERIRLEH